MESQNITPQPTGSPTISDSSDRSKFLKSLGFDRMEGNRTQNAALPSGSSGMEFDDFEDVATPVREAMVLSSNFEDDLELPGAMNLQEPVRTGFSNSPFADFGNATLEDEVHSESEGVVEAEANDFEEIIEQAVDEPVEISTRFEPEMPFDIASIDDSVWAAVDHRMRPEPIDLSTTPPRPGSKKKREHKTTVRSAVREARPPAMPPPLEDDPEPEAAVENEVPVVVENDAPEEVVLEEKASIDEPASERGPLNLNCPSCDRGLTLQPEHLGIPGNCVWCDTAIIAAESGLDHTVSIFRIANDPPASPKEADVEQGEDASPAAGEETVAVPDIPKIVDVRREEDSASTGEQKPEYSPWTEPANLDSPVVSEQEAVAPEPSSPPVLESTVPTLVAEPSREKSSSPVVEAEVVDDEGGLPEGEIVADPTAGPSIEVAKLQSAPTSSEESHFEEKSPFPDLSAPLPNSDEFPDAESVVNAEEINEAPSSPFEDLTPPSPFENPGVDGPFPETDSAVEDSAVDKPAPSFLESVATSNASPFDRSFDSEPADQEDLPMPGAFLSEGPKGISESPFDPPVKADGLPEPHSNEQKSEGSSSITALPWDEVRGSSELPRPNGGNVPTVGLPVADGPRPPMQPIPGPTRKPSVKKSKSRKSRTAVIIAVLGLVSGAGIASFFLPVDDYVVNLKQSWAEWFEMKADAGKEWSESAIVPNTPAESIEVEPDPFTNHKAPGAE